MINFRFHLVSLIAVFLALAVGIVIGSTVVDQAIVDGLRATVDRVEARSDETARENRALSAERDRLRSLVDELAPFTVTGRLSGVRVVFVAQRGVDDGVVESVRAWSQAAGALAPAIVWLDGAWTLDDDDTLARLREVTGSSGGPRAVRTLALGRLAERLSDSPTANGTTDGTTTTIAEEEPPDTTAPDVATTTAPPAGLDDGATADILVALVDAGFVSVDGIDADDLGRYPGGPTSAVLVGGPTADSPADVLTALARGFRATTAATVVVEAFEPGTDDDGAERERGATVAAIRDDDQLAAEVATVDHGEVTEGALAVVLALERAFEDRVGHYGYADGASSVLPPPAGT